MPKKNIPEVLTDYEPYLEHLKYSIRKAQVRAGLAVNRELVLLYWQIGNVILELQFQQGWGAKIIDRLAQDLRHAFPGITGFSARNLKYMRAFAEAYPDEPIVQAAPAQITWYHNCTLLDKVKAPEIRQWYAEQTIINGWSRDVLVHQIESGLHKRQGQAITNFDSTLPKPQSELAQQILKDPYNFEFLSLAAEALEKDLERSLLEKLKDFLLELGTGFAFVGSQYHLTVGDQDYYLDLLFYHLKARCFVVVDLKITDFKPEYVGKMVFYIAVVYDQLKHENDQPTIGLILCKTKNSVVAEYTVRSSQSPLGVSEYKISELLPEQIRANLPAIELLEKELTQEDLPRSPKYNEIARIMIYFNVESVVSQVVEHDRQKRLEHRILELIGQRSTQRVLHKLFLDGAKLLNCNTDTNGVWQPIRVLCEAEHKRKSLPPRIDITSWQHELV